MGVGMLFLHNIKVNWQEFSYYCRKVYKMVSILA